MLRWVGHGAVAVLDGGLRAWTAHGGALESGDAPVREEQFTARLGCRLRGEHGRDRARFARSPTTLLVDARASERFAGMVEPIDPVAGHVPGAVNHPMTAESRRRRPISARQRSSGAAGGSVSRAGMPGTSIAMCGSGVTACHNLLSLEAAGLRGGKLYAGSWSEWISRSAPPRRARLALRLRTRSFTCSTNLLWCARHEHTRQIAARTPRVENRTVARSLPGRSVGQGLLFDQRTRPRGDQAEPGLRARNRPLSTSCRA